MQVLGLAGEDENHYRVATRLVDDALRPIVTDLDATRTWQGREPGERWYKYRRDDVKALPRKLPNGRPIRIHGKFGREPGIRQWREVLYTFSVAQPRPAAVVLCWDVDSQRKRRDGMNAAREGEDWPFAVAVAVAEPEVEAWLVAGFEPRDAAEASCLAEVRDELSFDPTVQSHKLRSRPNDTRTDAKVILERLCGDDKERIEACLEDRARLREHGAKNGLTEFLDEVDQHILPLFGHVQ